MKPITTIILAAGKGVRMESSFPKILQDLMGRPLIYYVLAELLALKKYIKQIIVVIKEKDKRVENEIKNITAPGKTQIQFVYQSKILGTAGAVKSAAKKIKHNNVLILCADTPLITSGTLLAFIRSFLRKKVSFCVLTADISRKNVLGLIVRDKMGRLQAIREKVNLSKKSKAVPAAAGSQEINSGIYLFKRKTLLKNLFKIKKNKKKQEYFLTDIVEILYKQGCKINSYFLNNGEEILGINTQEDLIFARKVMRRRLLRTFSARGVRIIDPDTTFIQSGAKIGTNTIIYPFTFISKGVIIGSNCSVGPFIYLREGTSIDSNTQVGSFLEVNRTTIGKNVKIKHFGYLGDAIIEDNVNVGAGTVVANFDGKTKHKTYIEKNAFIGSDTILVAPVKVGKSAFTGAGSVVTKDVKSKTIAVGVPARILRTTKD